MNKAYLNAIRADSCYPNYRIAVDVLTLLGYFLAVAPFIYFLGMVLYYAFPLNQREGWPALSLLLIPFSLMIFIIVKIAQELSLMIVDIADATIESAGRRNEVALSSTTPDLNSVEVEPVLLQDMPNVVSPRILKKEEQDTLTKPFIVISVIAIAIGLVILFVVGIKLSLS